MSIVGSKLFFQKRQHGLLIIVDIFHSTKLNLDVERLSKENRKYSVKESLRDDETWGIYFMFLNIELPKQRYK